VGYEPFWQKVHGTTPPTFYSFEAGGWEILQVNGEHSEREPIIEWLDEHTNRETDCRLAFWHRPAYSAGSYEEGYERARRWWQELEGEARIVVSGHDHNLQRMRPRDGIVQFIAGAGGRKRDNVDERHPDLGWGDDDHFGALRLELSPGLAKWRFVSAHGRRLKSGSMRCHA
jgi:hypothetical protein